jgi:phage terminase Nu1 subunit (DNA packaging protein)
MRVAKAHAERHRLTLGQAVSELVRKAAERPLVTEERSGLRVLRLNRRSPRVTAARVDQLREDLP